MKKIYRIVGFVIIILYFCTSVFTLDSYGVNWDEVHHSTRGQAYLYYFLTGKEHYDQKLFEKRVRHSFYQMPNYDFTKQKTIDGDHPVFSDLMSSLFNYIFYQKLGIMYDFDSYHLYGPVIVTLFLTFLFFWVERYFGGFEAVVSITSLVLYPLFYGESHFNVQKDIPEAVFYGMAVMTFYTGYRNKSAKWIIASSLFFGFALGTKFNILFMPFTILLWLITKERLGMVRSFFRLPRLFKYSLFLYPFIGFGVFYFSWPHLWYDPVKNILQVLGYYKDYGIVSPSMPRSYYFYGSNTYAAQWIFYTTPLITLLFFAWGIIYTFTKGWREKNKTSLLIFFWLLVPMLRVTVPNTSIYGGVRQIMEYVPAFAVLSGIGASYLVQNLKLKMQNYLSTLSSRPKGNLKFKIFNFKLQLLTFIFELLIILLFIPITVKIWQMHPNESIYFNPIIGGLKGAKERNIPGWGNSLGSTYRQGVTWLNEHAEKNAKVALVHELVSNIPKTLLREDIKYSNTYRSGPKREGEYIVGVVHYGAYDKFYHRKYLERFLIPVHQVEVDGVPILKIWKNDNEHLKPEYKSGDREITKFTIIQESNMGRIVIEFLELVVLTKLEVSYNDTDCIVPIGKIRISKDNQTWESLPGTLVDFQGFHWFKPTMEKGKLQYLFADEVKVIRFTRNTEDSCLWKHPIQVKAWGYQKS